MVVPGIGRIPCYARKVCEEDELQPVLTRVGGHPSAACRSMPVFARDNVLLGPGGLLSSTVMLAHSFAIEDALLKGRKTAQ